MSLLGVRLDEKTHREFKLWCVRRGKNMSGIVRKLIEQWIEEQARLEEKLQALNEKQNQGE